MESDPIMKKLLIVREKSVVVRKLLDCHENLSTRSEPYKIKYEAIKVMKEMETILEEVLNVIPEDKKRPQLIRLVVVCLNMGILYTDTEELKAGEEKIMKCMELLKGSELDSDAVLPTLSSLNQLGIIWSHWGQPSKAKAFLDRAEQIYKDFIDTTTITREPVNMSPDFGIGDSKNELTPQEVLQGTHTLTLYYLAQVCSSLKDHHKSSMYCHLTLRRQLGHNCMLQDLDFVDWALNAATLSQYFMENEGFSQARHHLAAASFILKKYEDVLKEKTKDKEESEELAAKWENFKHRSADVARCWAKYGILLLSLSKQRLLQEVENDDQDDNKESKKNTEAQCMDNLKFDALEKHLEPIVNQVTDKYLLDFADAKPVFLNAQKWLEEAKTYYTLENHASDYISIAQDMSQAYKFLSFFEENEDTRAKMHKRRINILENILEELNPQYYRAACRQIWIELGETYCDVLDIKLDRLRATDEKPTAHALSKINHLAKTAIKYFQLFLDSLKVRDSNGKTSITKFPEDLVQPALYSYFHLAGLYNRIISPDKMVQIENTMQSINASQFVVDYCKKYPMAAEVIKDELSVCKELANLLPVKVMKLRQEMMNE